MVNYKNIFLSFWEVICWAHMTEFPFRCFNFSKFKIFVKILFTNFVQIIKKIIFRIFFRNFCYGIYLFIDKKMALKWKSEFLFISPWLLIASSESERREESHETEKERSFTGFMLKPEWDFDLNTWWYQRAHPKILMITQTSSVGLR